MEGLAHTAAMARAGELWNALDEKAKAPYVKKAQEDVKRQERQLKELKDKGYFIMADGTKSSDHEPKKRRQRKSKSKSEKKLSKGKMAKKGARKMSKKRASAVDKGIKSK